MTTEELLQACDDAIASGGEWSGGAEHEDVRRVTGCIVESIGFESAVFRLLWRGVPYVVLFSADGVFVSRARDCDGRLDELARYAVGRWRPCATHARELVRLSSGGHVAGVHAKRRRGEARVALRLVGE